MKNTSKARFNVLDIVHGGDPFDALRLLRAGPDWTIKRDSDFILGIKMGDSKKIIQDLADELDKYLEGKGFSNVPVYWDHSKREWQRTADWKIDRIILTVKWGQDIYIPFLILFPQKGKESKKKPYMIFDQTQSGKLCNKPNQRYLLPSFDIFASRYIKKTISEVDSVIGWFDKYNDVDSCIKMLIEKNGNPPESEGDRKRLNYLNKLKSQKVRTQRGKKVGKPAKAKLKRSR